MCVCVCAYVGLSCPQLFTPDKGSITCTEIQVTGETCTFACDLGYYLVGSETRLCLNDSVWTGEDASCLPRLCDELETEFVTQLVQPCDDEFMSECSYVCGDGYYLEDGTNTFDRACVVSTPLDVDWSPAADQCVGKCIIPYINWCTWGSLLFHCCSIFCV